MKDAFKYYDQRLHSTKPLNPRDALIFQTRVGGRLQEIYDDDMRLGRFRTRKDEWVEIGGEPLIPPPPGKKLQGLIGDLFGELASRGHKHESVEDIYRTTTWFHFMFEKFHPFMDFNGRVGRLLADLYLEQNGFEPVADWRGEERSRAVGGKVREVFQKPYLNAIEETERLRCNRWDPKFKDIPLTDFGGVNTTFGSIGEDYLLPLESTMMVGGIKTELRFLKYLHEEKATPEQIEFQEDRVRTLGHLYSHKTSKLKVLKDQAAQVFGECEVVDWSLEHPDDPHGAPMWEEFISPQIK